MFRKSGLWAGILLTGMTALVSVLLGSGAALRPPADTGLPPDPVASAGTEAEEGQPAQPAEQNDDWQDDPSDSDEDDDDDGRRNGPPEWSNAGGRGRSEDKDRGGPLCRRDGKKQHPQIGKLAEEFGVSEDHILVLACDAGLNGGQIRQAYHLAEASGEPVETVLALYEELGNWGHVKQELGTVGTGPDDEDVDQ